MMDREKANMTTTAHRKRQGRPRIRFQPDLRITVRFRVGRDEELLAWLERLPDRRRAESIRQTLRRGLWSPGEEM
jgi:hypothetical protein